MTVHELGRLASISRANPDMSGARCSSGEQAVRPVVSEIGSPPKRIQRQRTKGWRMPPGAMYVGRPSRWGNPYLPWPDTRPEAAVNAFASDLRDHEMRDAAAFARWLAPLRGHDLACWCALDQPCHADVLLELANR